jgi:pyruvate/2-oxoglutarate/acetoin dehydrogenase E1 component
MCLSFSWSASAGQLGATHSQALENWFAILRSKVVVPSTPYDAKVFESLYTITIL